MTIEECKEFMAWAKADIKQMEQNIEDAKANIELMHEEGFKPSTKVPNNLSKL